MVEKCGNYLSYFICVSFSFSFFWQKENIVLSSLRIILLLVQPCNNPDCWYLHDFGSQEDSFTKDELLSAFERYMRGQSHIYSVHLKYPIDFNVCIMHLPCLRFHGSFLNCQYYILTRTLLFHRSKDHQNIGVTNNLNRHSVKGLPPPTAENSKAERSSATNHPSNVKSLHVFWFADLFVVNSYIIVPEKVEGL